MQSEIKSFILSDSVLTVMMMMVVVVAVFNL